MADKIISGLSAFVIATISSLGYAGVVLMMAIESACIPLPSEIIMPFSGYLVATGRFGLQMVAIAGAVGCLLGSYVAYFVGSWGGRPFIERYGRYILIAPHELETADRFFERWGSHAVFWSRMLPVVRTFIAFPGRRDADETGPIHHLHADRVIYMVPRAGVLRDETRAALEGSRAVLSSLRRIDRDTVGRGRRRPHL